MTDSKLRSSNHMHRGEEEPLLGHTADETTSSTSKKELFVTLPALFVSGLLNSCKHGALANKTVVISWHYSLQL